MNQQLINYILATLDDPHGISQVAWEALLTIQFDNQETSDAIADIVNQVDGCEDRYYLPGDHPVIEEYRKA